MLLISNQEAKDLRTYRKAIVSMDECLHVQTMPGNWDYDPYMHGMANGMILFRSFFFDESTDTPNFLNAPSEWVSKKSITRHIKNFIKKHFGFTNQ